MRRLLILGSTLALVAGAYFWARAEVHARFDIPRPEFTPSPPFSLAPSESIVRVPMRLPISALSEAIAAIPKRTVFKDDWDQEREDEKIILDRGEPSFRCAPGGVRWALPFQFTYGRRDCSGWGHVVWWTVSAAPSGEVSGFTRLGLDADFNVVSATSVDRLRWTTPGGRVIAKVESGVTHERDVTDLANGKANEKLTEISAKIDAEAVSRLRVRERLASAWAALAADIPLGDDAWLRLGPEALGAGDLACDGDSVATLTLSLRARPLVLLGKRPPPTARVETPKNSGAIPGRGFRVACPVLVEYGRLAIEFRKAWVGKPISLGPDGRYSVSVLDADVQGDSEQITIVLSVSGAVNGSIVLRGRLQLDPVAKTLWLADLSYTDRTRELLPKAFSWLFDVDLTGALQHAAGIPFSTELERVTRLADRALHRRVDEHLEIVGHLSTPLEALAARSTADGLELLVVIEGEATAVLK